MRPFEPPGEALVALGLFLLVGYAAHVLGRRAHVPRVTLLLIVGVLLGPSGVSVIPQDATRHFPMVTQLALSVVGFTLGEQFLGKKLRRMGAIVTAVSLSETLAASAAVFFILLVAGTPLPFALLLAGVAPASAPAATLDVVRESGARGVVTDTVLGVVAIDDALGIIMFSILMISAEAVAGAAASWSVLLGGVWEIAGAALLGLVIGVPMAWLTGRVRPGELTLVEALGFVLVVSGLARVLGVSYLMACITLGAVVANRAHHHERPFHAIEGVSQPFIIVFFLMAGAELDLSRLASFGWIALAYVVGRTLGLVSGGYIGARIARADRAIRNHVGWCLLPQAGVALGLGLVAAQRFPEFGPDILSLLIGTTFFFEVAGPIATRIALFRAGEVQDRA